MSYFKLRYARWRADANDPMLVDVLAWAIGGFVYGCACIGALWIVGIV